MTTNANTTNTSILLRPRIVRNLIINLTFGSSASLVVRSREHVGNNFSPAPSEYANEFLVLRNEIMRLYLRSLDSEAASLIRNDAAILQSSLSDYRKRIIHDIQTRQLNIEAMTVFLSVVQESQELLSALRHLMRGEGKIGE